MLAICMFSNDRDVQPKEDHDGYVLGISVSCHLVTLGCKPFLDIVIAHSCSFILLVIS
jgi:hypothetical protein